MGARGNFEFNFDYQKLDGSTKEVGSVFLYTHWNGDRTEEILREALSSQSARQRWDDPMYLTRILISKIVGEDHNGELGWGIAPYPGEEEFDTIKILVEQGAVVVGGRTLTFMEFVSGVD